ncbi:Hsp20/alpha crystallin family protein [Enterovirga sp. CN4-39]|uniref:Hsp20/alpha crystallin family protein n=1 Tax=Enterovirga sp. CN4-39 TaxID=3400910 RepID=UPI003C10124C
MKPVDPRSWMWSEAVEMLARAERMQREMFQPRHPQARSTCWEPPVDVLETEREVIVLTALPGVDPRNVTAVIEEGTLLIRAERTLPPELGHAVIHRLELPQGCFVRRVQIPPGRYDDVRRTSANGCLVVTLHKHAPAR